MVFSSMTFLLLFLPLVLLLYFLVPGLKGKNTILLAASLLFYAWGEPVCVLAMLASTAVNYFCARLIASTADGRKRKAALGTRNTSCRSSVTICRLAVMPGSNARSRFWTRTTPV